MFGLPSSFWLENVHFVVYIFAALGLFAAGWLNYDSYKDAPDRKILLRAIGFFILALWALAQSSGFKYELVNWIVFILEFSGIGLVALGFYIEPMPDNPNSPNKTSGATAGAAETKESGSTKKDKPALLVASVGSIAKTIVFKLPVIIWIAAFIRINAFATKGLIKDFLGLRTAILFILLSRIVAISDVFASSPNVIIFNLTREYSYLWILQIMLMLIGSIILVKWTFYYLSFRPGPQLFITFVTTSLVILVAATVVFTGMLFKYQKGNLLETLKKSAAVFEYSLNELGRQTSLAAYSIAQREKVVSGVSENDVAKAVEGLGNPIDELKVGGVTITNRSGEALAVSGSYFNIGQGMASDPTVAKALEGKPTSSIISQQLQDQDQLLSRSSYPIVKDAKAIGTIVVDYPIDQAFVDNVKEVTRLDVSINIGTVRNSSTFTDSNGRRITGTEITNKNVLDLVNNYKKSPWAWAGEDKLINQPYLCVYRSLADSDNMNIASLMVAESRINLVNQISQSIKITFLVTSIMILLSLIPLYFLAKTITRGQKV